jgi:hypothetical protein
MARPICVNNTLRSFRDKYLQSMRLLCQMHMYLKLNQIFLNFLFDAEVSF